MKIFGAGRSHRSIKTIAVTLSFILVFCIGSFATALGASGEGGGSKGWIATDTFRVMNFLVLAVGLFLILRKPLTQALSSRISGIKDQLAELEEQKAAAEKQLAEYNKKLSQLEKEADKIVADYIKQGNEAKARILKEAESAAEKLQAQAHRNIEHEFEQAKLKLQADILEKSLIKAEAIIEQKISGEDQERLVDEYLKKVVAG